ncbi:hypothetical protein PCANC_11458 [Puccinia coronata f. sp. avenae]|uniref:Uncharacterized protein n=1 Tax=Puccinia coronata f. sp. avenae TaxID=200324 RepID=A0A2N5VCL8_9BASI|nr:hypothetical protein PCANC_11458 [Puccinia coronata f. sp. avenae]
MPGFMQSLKSRLPQSPFSPPKQSAAALPAVELEQPADGAVEEQPVPEEQPAAEVLPSEALLAPNASTVALTLTPASGQSSQQLASPDEQVTEPETAPAEESAPVVEPPTHPEAKVVETAVVSERAEPAPTAAETTASEAEASILAPVEEVSVEESVVPELPANEVAQEALPSEPLTPSISAGAPENQEVLSTEETLPAEKVMAASVRSQRSITRKEPPVLTAAELAAVEATAITDAPAVVATPLEVDTTALAPQPALEKSHTAEVKGVKQQKKKRFGLPPLKSFGSSNNSDGGNSTDESGNAAAAASAKPKKTPRTPLAGRFKNVLGQVRSRVKKDKDSEHTPTKEATSDNALVAEQRTSSDDKAVSTDQLAPPSAQSDPVKTIEIPVDAPVSSDEAVTA